MHEKQNYHLTNIMFSNDEIYIGSIGMYIHKHVMRSHVQQLYIRLVAYNSLTHIYVHIKK